MDDAAAYVAGGYGDVYSATMKGSNAQRVAVKQLRPAGDKQQRLRVAAVRIGSHPFDLISPPPQALARELRVWWGVAHENILPLKAFYFDDAALGPAWIITEWQDHGNLHDYVVRNNPDAERRLTLVWIRAVPPTFGLYSVLGN